MKKELLSNDVNWSLFNEQIPLGLDATHIFAVPVYKHFQHVKKSYAEVLSDREEEKASRLFNPKDKERYIVSKYCLRKILAHFSNTHAHQLEFEFQDNKKPTIIMGIDFNISHTEDYVLIVISAKPVGIDVEFLNRDFDFKSILPISFSQKEISFIGEEEVDPLNFYLLWTRKEALLKATGEGISDNLHQVECMNSFHERNGENYKMKSLILDDNYLVSLAVQKDQHRLKFWKWL